MRGCVRRRCLGTLKTSKFSFPSIEHNQMKTSSCHLVSLFSLVPLACMRAVSSVLQSSFCVMLCLQNDSRYIIDIDCIQEVQKKIAEVM